MLKNLRLFMLNYVKIIYEILYKNQIKCIFFN